jgi:hypothetical protein
MTYYSTLQNVKFRARGKVPSTLVIYLQVEIRISTSRKWSFCNWFM